MKISAEDFCRDINTRLGHFITSSIGELTEEQHAAFFKIYKETNELDVRLTANGVDLPVKPVIEFIYTCFYEEVKKGVEERIEKEFSSVSSLLHSLETKIKRKLSETKNSEEDS